MIDDLSPTIRGTSFERAQLANESVVVEQLYPARI
jgi:hypothetical protein